MLISAGTDFCSSKLMLCAIQIMNGEIVLVQHGYNFCFVLKGINLLMAVYN